MGPRLEGLIASGATITLFWCYLSQSIREEAERVYNGVNAHVPSKGKSCLIDVRKAKERGADDGGV